MAKKTGSSKRKTTKTRAATKKRAKRTAYRGKASPLSVRHVTKTASPKPGSKAQRGLAVEDPTSKVVIGVDLGDRVSCTCTLDALTGKVLSEGSVPTTKHGLEAVFGQMSPALIVLETGTHSPWVSRFLAGLGHEVLVANSRKLDLITRNDKKNDKLDAMRLAQLARVDRKLLHPVRPRSQESQIALASLKARDGLVTARTGLINRVRGIVKSFGERLPKCDSETFHKRAAAALPEALRPALDPLLEVIARLTADIRRYDDAVKKLAKTQFPSTERLTQVQGVGALTALAYVLVIDDPARFARSDGVPAYLGLVPRQRDSGDSTPQMRITKSGNAFARRLLVGSAHYILGHWGQDSDLRRWGLKLCERGGKSGKKRAVVAVARKLAVLLHRLWLSGEDYEPLRNSGNVPHEARAAEAPSHAGVK